MDLDDIDCASAEPLPEGPGPCPGAPQGCPNLENGNTPTGHCLDCVDKIYAEVQGAMAVDNYVALLDELLARRVNEGLLTEEEEYRYQHVLLKSRREMTPEDVALIPAEKLQQKRLSDLERGACLAEGRLRMFKSHFKESRRWRAALQIECPHEHVVSAPSEVWDNLDGRDPPVRMCLYCKIAEEGDQPRLLMAEPEREISRGQLLSEMKGFLGDLAHEEESSKVTTREAAALQIRRLNDIRPADVLVIYNPEPLTFAIRRALESDQPGAIAKTLEDARKHGRMEEWAEALVQQLEDP